MTINGIRTGIRTALSMRDVSVSNTDQFSRPAVLIESFFYQIQIAEVMIDNVSIDTDGSIFKIELATVLQLCQLNFTSIKSSTSSSNNNYMIMIDALELDASFPSLIQNVSVSNSTVGLLHAETVTGNLSENNLFSIQDIHISDCYVENNIDMITLTLLSTYDPYAIIFSNMIFSNLEFKQGGNILNFEYLLTIPVQIMNSEFRNITGGKISVKSFTSNIADLSTNVVMSNITVDDINSQFDSFITLQTGAVLSISDSSFTNMN